MSSFSSDPNGDKEASEPKLQTETSGPGNGQKKARTAIGSGGAGGGRKRRRRSTNDDMPEELDVEELCEQALRQRGETISLSWTSAETGVQFLLTVECDTSEYDPRWVCFKLQQQGNKRLWGFATREAYAICNLISETTKRRFL